MINKKLLIMTYVSAFMSIYLLTGGHALLSASPLVMGLCVAVFIFLPPRYSASAFLFFALLVDNPEERPMDGKWESPLYTLGKILYVNAHKTLGLSFLKFSFLEFIFAAFIILILIKKLSHKTHNAGPSASCLKTSLTVSVVTILCLELWGLLRGGDFKNSLWQFRQLLWLPLITLVFGHTFKSRRDHQILGILILIVALLRAGLGFYFKYAIAIPRGYTVEYLTTHSDAVLTVTAVMILIISFLEKPSVFVAILSAVLLPLYIFALIGNERRIAFVSLAMCVFACYFLFKPSIRSRLTALFVLSLPLLVTYTGVGWFSGSKLFKPVHIIKSVFDKTDASNGTRDIENYNLIYSAKQHPLLGSGFGHEYIEQVKAYQIDHIFQQYRYIAHNSILWFVNISGIVGLISWWMSLAIGVFLARRIYLLSKNSTQRIVSLTSICVLICFLVQAYGDMGFQSWMCVLLVGSTFGILGPLASETGAWPQTKQGVKSVC